jgi:hypothetical protein
MAPCNTSCAMQEPPAFTVDCFGFRGRGGFTVTLTESMQRELLLDNLYADKEYQLQNSRPHHHWAEKSPIPQTVPAGSWTFGYRLTDDPYEWGGTGAGEYYFTRA